MKNKHAQKLVEPRWRGKSKEEKRRQMEPALKARKAQIEAQKAGK